MNFSTKEWMQTLLSSLAVLVCVLSVACAPERMDAERAGDDDDSAREVQEDQSQEDGEPCEQGQVDDCESVCSPESWLGDGACDQAFNCEAFIFDYGDCFFES